MFDYNIHVRIVPARMKRGKRAKITVVVADANKEIAYCVGRIRGYNMKQKLGATGENTFTLTLGIPIIAPRGNYLVEVYAVSQDGEKGPFSQLEVEVI